MASHASGNNLVNTYEKSWRFFFKLQNKSAFERYHTIYWKKKKKKHNVDNVVLLVHTGSRSKI